MSLILDALRKSEAERRRGQSPDLFAGTPVLPQRPSTGWRRPAFLFVAPLLVLAIALWAWRQGAPVPTATELPVALRTMDTVPPTAASPSDSDRPGQTAPRPPAEIPVAPPAFQAPPALAGDTAGAVPAAVAAPPPPPSPEPIAIAQPAMVAPPVEAAPPDNVAPIAVLSATERSALPPMKLSMHVWNSDPGRRFAIVDGQRIAEGALVGGAVVEEIRRDGVVLNINGRRLLLSRP